MNIQDYYCKTLTSYLDNPFISRHEYEDLEDELTFIERNMLDNPPAYQRLDGTLHPRKAGAINGSPIVDSGKLPRANILSLPEAGIKSIPVREWPDIMGNSNRTAPSEYCPFTLDQDGVGSCGAEGSVGGLMERRVADGQGHVLLNPWAIYHTTSGGRDGGSSPLDNLSFLQKYGCPSMKVWPRSKGWRKKPSDEAMQDALQYRISNDGLVRPRNWEELGTLLLLGFACPIGYRGHWIFATDLASTTRLKYKNSWGSDFGNDGFGTLSKNSVYWSYGVWGVIAVIDRRTV